MPAFSASLRGIAALLHLKQDRILSMDISYREWHRLLASYLWYQGKGY